jgi:hypothetical protein
MFDLKPLEASLQQNKMSVVVECQNMEEWSMGISYTYFARPIFWFLIIWSILYFTELTLLKYELKVTNTVKVVYLKWLIT